MVRLASLVAAGALFGSAAAVAGEPVELTSAQLDGVTAGFEVDVTFGAANGAGIAAATGLITGAFTETESETNEEEATASGDASAFSVFGGGSFAASGSATNFTSVFVED
jgi:hypothetical protein